MKNPINATSLYTTPRNLGIDFVFIEHNITKLKCCVQLSNFLHGQKCRAKVRDEHLELEISNEGLQRGLWLITSMALWKMMLVPSPLSYICQKELKDQ